MRDVNFREPSFVEEESTLVEDSFPQDVVSHVRHVVAQYLAARPQLSVNGISKKCGVSEPTLRRIMGGKIKTVPQVTTILDILTYIAGTNSVREVKAMYPGAIADFLSDAMPFLDNVDQDYSNALNEQLKNPVKYLIYKLSANHNGVSEDKIVELYGNHGLQQLKEMVLAGFICSDENRVCHANAKSFSTSYDDFVSNFKIVADFIKPSKHRNRKTLNPFFVNASESLSPEAYEQIVRLQRQTQKKIRKILADPNSKGHIPSFYLCAFDSLDLRSAYELEESESGQD